MAYVLTKVSGIDILKSFISLRNKCIIFPLFDPPKICVRNKKKLEIIFKFRNLVFFGSQGFFLFVVLFVRMILR